MEEPMNRLEPGTTPAMRGWLLSIVRWILRWILLGSAIAACANPAWSVEPPASARSDASGSKATDAASGDLGAGLGASAVGSSGVAARVSRTDQFRDLMPSALFEQEGAEAFQNLIATATRDHTLLPASSYQARRARGILGKLAPAAVKWSDRVKQWQWDIVIVNSPRIDIVCLPGGKVVISSGLLYKIRPNDDELAMLLGHVIAHAVREHERDKLGREAASGLPAGGMPQLFGLNEMTPSLSAMGPRILALRYSRDDETEADVIGTDIAARAGYDPRATITIWNRLAASSLARKQFLVRHPFDQARIADFRKRLPDMLMLYAKALNTSVARLPAYPRRPARR
jgi:Zn-dependent protease with chaperone function